MEITASAIQNVAVNGNVLFTETPVHGGKCITHRDGSGLVTLRGLTNQCFARFLIMFGANISGTVAGAISMAIAVNGEPLPSSKMMTVSVAVDDYWNVSSFAYIDVPKGCCITVSVENTSATPINVQSANLIATRVA